MAKQMNYREQNFQDMDNRLGDKYIVKAWNLNTNRQANNTYLVRSNPNRINLEFHGYVIASFWRDGTIAISNAGFETATTKHRLNGFNWLSVWQKDFQWFYDAQGYEGKFDGAVYFKPDGSIELTKYDYQIS